MSIILFGYSIMSFTTYDNEDVHDIDNELTRDSTIKSQTNHKKEDIRDVPSCWCCLRNKSVEPRKLNANKAFVAELPPIDLTYLVRTSMSTQITTYYEMPDPNQVDSMGSPIDPYKGRINPGRAWF